MPQGCCGHPTYEFSRGVCPRAIVTGVGNMLKRQRPSGSQVQMHLSIATARAYRLQSV